MSAQDPHIAEALKLDWGLEGLVAAIRASDPDWEDGFKDQILAMAFFGWVLQASRRSSTQQRVRKSIGWQLPLD